MASLKDLKIRIGSVKSTQKITKAMKMVAAAKLRRAREAAENARPYALAMEQMVTSLATSVADADNAPKLLAGTGDDKTHLIVVATADRGLCGGFNSSIVKSVRAKVHELKAANKTVKLLCVGKKGREQLQTEFGNLFIDCPVELTKGGLNYQKAEDVVRQIIELFEAGEFDVCEVVFNLFKSPLVQEVTHQQLIPLALPEEAPESESVYEYEPDEESVLADVLPRNLGVQIFKALLENAASEQGARMTAMDNATRNAGEMIDKLTLQYNRTRQAAITTELTEIISGAEAI